MVDALGMQAEPTQDEQPTHGVQSASGAPLDMRSNSGQAWPMQQPTLELPHGMPLDMASMHGLTGQMQPPWQNIPHSQLDFQWHMQQDPTRQLECGWSPIQQGPVEPVQMLAAAGGWDQMAFQQPQLEIPQLAQPQFEIPQLAYAHGLAAIPLDKQADQALQLAQAWPPPLLAEQQTHAQAISIPEPQQQSQEQACLAQEPVVALGHGEGQLQPNVLGQLQTPPVVPPLALSLTRPPPVLPAQLQADFETDAANGGSLGEGAFAAVRKLRNRSTGEIVALKIVEKQPLLIRNMMAQLQREVRMQGAMHHPNIVRLCSFLEDEAYVYMSLEYCSGGSLRELSATLPNLRFAEPHAAALFAQILQGVDHMHRHSCVHRDLKPDNVLLTGSGEVRICDFGWCAEVLVEKALLTTCGTPNYWAPEIFEGLPQSFPVDLWALGNLLYDLLVGHSPFWGSTEELRVKILAVDLRYPPGLLSDDAIHLFHCLLQRDPARRAPAAWMLAEHAWVGRGMPQPPAMEPPPDDVPPDIPVEAAPPPEVDSSSSIQNASVVNAGVDVPVFLSMPVTVVAATTPPAADALAVPASGQEYSRGRAGNSIGRDNGHFDVCGVNGTSTNFAVQADQGVEDVPEIPEVDMTGGSDQDN